MNALAGETNVLGHFNFNFRHILIDEIALEGLEGIALSSLWKRVEHRISSPLTEKMKSRFWRTILCMKDVYLYQLPEPLPIVQIRDRFTLVDEETGDLKDPEEYLDGPYDYCPVPHEHGSCKYYNTRKLIPNQILLHVPYIKIFAEYEDSLVLVASIEQRWQALANHLPITFLQQLTPIQYCILELVGKSRENGQMTTGKTNLTNIIKEPKNLFYNRRTLKNLDLIKELCVIQSLGTRGIKSILIRLNRFHQPSILSVPKIGKIHKIIQYLKTRPNYEEKTDELYKNGLLSCQQGKRLKKRNNMFDFIEKPSLNDNDQPVRKKSKKNPLVRKRRYIFLSTQSDESSQSEDEVTEEPVKCQYNIGVGLMRQAYERLLDAGLRGLSQIELGQKLGLEFYTSRMLCKVFKAKKIVREFFEDKGKQRISRYVAVATGHDDAKYIEERNKFLEYINQNLSNSIEQSASSSETITPAENNFQEACVKIEEQGGKLITDLTNSTEDIKSILESKKSLTLRQLRFGNGLLKIVKEKQCVTGFQTLSNLVAKEIKEPPMVTKALKVFLQKLVAAGQIKIYRMKWPGHEYAMNLVCAPHIKTTDHIVQTKYKELIVRAMARKPQPKKDMGEHRVKPLSMYIYPRYMKIQKLHETIIKMAYFDKINRGSTTLPEGFLSVTEFMPEITVKFAISNMSTIGIAEISHLRLLETYLNMKLKDAPADISYGIMKCKSLKNSLRMNLKALAMYGLIQLIYQPDVQTADYTNNTLVSFLFYVNRNAKIINTMGKWPREVPDVDSLERSYYFETFDDVKQFWKDVYDISINTKITITENRTKKTLNPPVRREYDVQLHDNGDRFGDWSGPCGFDSCFFMEIARLWRTYYVRENKHTPFKKKPQVKKPQKLAKSQMPKKPIKKKVPKVNPVMKIKTVTKGRKRIPESTIIWSLEEDRLIIMCQAAITIASPSSQPGSLRVRNIVAKDILGINDPKKTTSACHRRALMLQLNPNLMHEKDSLLNEMRRRGALIHKYQGLIKKLRLRHSANMTKFMNEARLPILELVWLIWQVSKSESYNQKMPCVALDVETFHKNFSIVPATANKWYNMYKSPDLEMLREGVFLTIISTFNREIKPETAKKIYSIFKTFPENSLRIVIDQLRRCAAVSAKEKILNNQMHRLHLEDIVQSAYKISAHYQRRWIGRLNSEYADSLAKIMRSDLPSENIKGSAEINCVLCELHANNVIDVVTATEPEIVDTAGLSTNLDESTTVNEVESKHKLKSGSVTWKKKENANWNTKTVSTLYPFSDFEMFLKDMIKNAVVLIDDAEMYEITDKIVCFLQEKGESGASFEDLQKITGFDRADLVKRLATLESENIVKRVGLSNNMLVLMKFIKNWTLKVENNYIIVTPWLTLNLDIRYDIFLEWTGVIVNKIFENPGISIGLLSDMLELITNRAVQDACMFLEKCKIITLQIVKCPESDIFSDEDVMPDISEFHPYESVSNMLAHPVKDTITKYVHLRKIMLEKYGNVKH